MQLSPHPALQWTRSCARQRSASRRLPCPPAVHLRPFALCVAFPRSLVGRDSDDYYGLSVTIGLAPHRPSRFPSVRDVLARRRWLVRPLQWAHCPPPTRRRVPVSATWTPSPGGPATDAVIGERVLASLETELQAIRPSPYRAGLAEQGHKRLLAISAFPPCYCPLWLSPPGEVGDPEAIFLRTSPFCERDH
jgi:hypothetical protein